MINVSLDDPDHPTCVTIKPGKQLISNDICTIDVELTIVEIDIQVGAGYVIPNND